MPSRDDRASRIRQYKSLRNKPSDKSAPCLIARGQRGRAGAGIEAVAATNGLTPLLAELLLIIIRCASYEGNIILECDAFRDFTDTLPS